MSGVSEGEGQLASGHGPPELLGATPALPVRDVRAAAEFYRSKFGSEPVHVVDGFAVVVRGHVELHLWEADDESWRERPGFAARPVRSGGESFLAGTASCRINTIDVLQLFYEFQAAGVLHPTAGDAPTRTDFETVEFPTLDLDGNLLTFFRWGT